MALAVLGLLSALTGQAGCSDGWRVESSGGLFRNLLRGDEEKWTIRCMEVRGQGCRAQTERIAKALQRTRGIKPKKVFIVHGDDVSRVYYGRYIRPVVKETSQFGISQSMRNDMALIKDLAVEGERFFAESRIVPVPTPDVGNSAWSLDNNPGVYTLRVALFYHEPGFTRHKKAAAVYCEELRSKGYEAYYRHGERTSEVFVGSFGEDAQIQVRRSGVFVNVPGQQVQALQMKETFRYELWNMKARSRRYGAGKIVRSSRVMKVHENEDYFDEFQ